MAKLTPELTTSKVGAFQEGNGNIQQPPILTILHLLCSQDLQLDLMKNLTNEDLVHEVA